MHKEGKSKGKKGSKEKARKTAKQDVKIKNRK